MPKVLLSGYSDYYDVNTGVQFEPTLDRANGLFVAIADVSADQAAEYAKRSAFQVLSDDEYLALSQPAPSLEPQPSESGDPLTDQAKAQSGAAPNSVGANGDVTTAKAGKSSAGGNGDGTSPDAATTAALAGPPAPPSS